MLAHISQPPNAVDKTVDPEFFSIENLIKTRLPPLPANVMRVSALLADYDASPKKVADAISLDPILSTRLLRLANSPIYGVNRSVTSLSQAVARVGNTEIHGMLMVSGISDSFGRKVLGSPAGKAIWSHLLAVAVATSEICNYANMRGADDAFTCGLLHDIGKLILLRADMPLYSGLLDRAEEGEDIRVLEQEAFGFDHTELGASVANAWNLSPALAHMIRHHHDPTKASSGIAMVRFINIADRFVHLHSSGANMFELFMYQSVIDLGLTQEMFDSIWEKITERLAVAETF